MTAAPSELLSPQMVRPDDPHDPALVRFQPKDRLDRLFELGIVLKGLNGLVELIIGTLLLIITPGQIAALTSLSTGSELTESWPIRLGIQHIAGLAAGLSATTLLFAALYLLVHGVVKVVLVAALLRNQLWAYPWMTMVLIGFVGYQMFELTRSSSPGLLALTVFDLMIITLTIREYRKQRSTPIHSRLR